MVRIITENGVSYIEVVSGGKTIREMYNDKASINDAACLVSNVISRLR